MCNSLQAVVAKPGLNGCLWSKPATQTLLVCECVAFLPVGFVFMSSRMAKNDRLSTKLLLVPTAANPLPNLSDIGL